MQGRLLYIEDIADCNFVNTPEEYAKHASATASSRAESRVYRKALRLRKVISAEEANSAGNTDENWTTSEPITTEQVTVFDVMCKKNNISVFDYINCGDAKYACIEMISKATAQRMLQHLNRIQRQDAELPSGVGPYDENWQIKNDDKDNES